MPGTIEPGEYRFELKLSAPEERHVGGEIVARPPATEEGIRDWLISRQFPHLRGKAVAVELFRLTRI